MTYNFHKCLLILFLCRTGSANVDEITFHQVINNIKTLYQQAIENVTKKSLAVHADWKDTSAGPFHISSARCSHDLAILNIRGHVAQHPSTTLGSLVLFICHEAGHFLGGEPKKEEKLFKWSSIEGQADFWASHCYRTYFTTFPENLPQTAIISLQNACQNTFVNIEDQKLCRHQMYSIEAISNYLIDTDYINGRHVDLENTDTTVAQKTKPALPTNQCRIDTFIAGALNNKRPSCWFAP